MTAHTHCHHCGEFYHGMPDSWPRKCDGCGKMAFKNPTPVAVAVTPVLDDDGKILGLLAIERTIAPLGVALPGGFVDLGETHQTAAIREVREETGLTVELASDDPYALCSAVDTNTILIFMQTKPITLDDLALAVGSDETSGATFIKADQTDQIVFPLHKQIADRWFAETAYVQELLNS